MTPKRLDADGVLQKLEAIELFVADLEALGSVTAAELVADRARRNIAERALIGLVDLAAAVNAHLAAASGEPAPTTYRSSLQVLARLGALDGPVAYDSVMVRFDR
jgi:uncharacterized protein YutE (UPF0331/DUF86 family)